MSASILKFKGYKKFFFLEKYKKFFQDVIFFGFFFQVWGWKFSLCIYYFCVSTIFLEHGTFEFRNLEARLWSISTFGYVSFTKQNFCSLQKLLGFMSNFKKFGFFKKHNLRKNTEHYFENQILKLHISLFFSSFNLIF